MTTKGKENSMTPAIGDNSDKAAKDRMVLFAFYHRIDRDIAAKVRELNEQKKSNRQNAKASGFPAQKLDHYLKSFLAEDQQKPVDKLMSEAQNLMWLGLIPDTRGGDLLKQVDRVDGEAMVRARGFHAGLNGLDRVSGYDAGSSDDKIWLESFDAGRSEYETNIPDILARLDAAAEKEAASADEYGEDPFN